MNSFPSLNFGGIGKALNWRELEDTDDEDGDELLDATPPGIVTLLGFDPLDFAGAADGQPELPDDENEDGDSDEPLAHTPQGLIEELGFDPLDLMAEDSIEDAQGHLHGENDGKFVTKGGGGGPATEHVSAAKAAASKSVREGLRKLFKTGHSFSVKELAEVLELPEKTVKTALHFIKNPKKATAKFSSLELVHDPKTGQYSLKKMTEASIIDQKLKVAEAQNSDYEKVKAGAAKTAKGIYGGMPEKQADEHYSQQMKAAAQTLYDDLAEDLPYAPAMLKWKQARALNMAQWKANTTGKDVPVPEQFLFHADELLWKDVQADVPWEKAFQNWKHNTAQEKLGHLQQKKQEAEYESTGPVYEAPNAADYEGAHKIAASFKQIGKSQFKGLKASDTEYYKGFTETHQKFEAGSNDKVENKIVVQKDIEARLKSSTAFQKLQDQFAGKKNSYNGVSLVRYLVGAWAGSSGDHSPTSAYMQHIVADVFKMDSGSLALGHIAERNKALMGFRTEIGQIAASTSEIEAGLRDFVRAQYDNTQAFLKKQGLTEIHVARGMKMGTSKDKAEEVNLKLQPASSFSHNHYTAASFAGSGSVYMVKVPASQVLGSYRTGYGCTNEQEVTLLAAPNMKAIAIGKNFAPTAETAAWNVRDQMGIK